MATLYAKCKLQQHFDSDRTESQERVSTVSLCDQCRELRFRASTLSKRAQRLFQATWSQASKGTYLSSFKQTSASRSLTNSISLDTPRWTTVQTLGRNEDSFSRRAACGFCEILYRLLERKMSNNASSRRHEVVLARKTVHDHEYHAIMIQRSNALLIDEDILVQIRPQSDFPPRFDQDFEEAAVKLDQIYTLRAQLSICRASHTLCNRQRSRNLVVSIYLIDIEEMRLVPADSTYEYLALSYVWGNVAQYLHKSGSRTRLLSKAGLLDIYNKQLPNVVKQAIELATELGFRYLWVDTLCIVQDDIAHTQSQTEHMDVIYGCAVLTIAAVSAESVTDNLWTVPPRLSFAEILAAIRTFEKTHDVSIDFAKSTEATFNTEIFTHDAKYFRRGWTYQEDLLSRRVVYCSTSGLQLVCSKPYLTRRPVGVSSMDSRMHIATELEAKYASTMSQERAFNLYAHMLNHYSAREFTYKSDAIRGFAGIIGALNMGDESHAGLGQFACGLPMCHLSRALAWASPTLRGRRRAIASGTDIGRHDLFPSWSWASAHCQVLHVKPASFTADNRRAWPTVWVIPFGPVGTRQTNRAITELKIENASVFNPSDLNPSFGPSLSVDQFYVLRFHTSVWTWPAEFRLRDRPCSSAWYPTQRYPSGWSWTHDIRVRLPAETFDSVDDRSPDVDKHGWYTIGRASLDSEWDDDVPVDRFRLLHLFKARYKPLGQVALLLRQMHLSVKLSQCDASYKRAGLVKLDIDFESGTASPRISEMLRPRTECITLT